MALVTLNASSPQLQAAMEHPVGRLPYTLGTLTRGTLTRSSAEATHTKVVTSSRGVGKRTHLGSHPDPTMGCVTLGKLLKFSEPLCNLKWKSCISLLRHIFSLNIFKNRMLLTTGTIRT